MRFIRKLLTFAKLKWRMKLLLIEAYLYLALARYLKSIPFSRVAPTLGKGMEETTNVACLSQKAILRNISWAIHTMSSYTFWESECLVKALAGMKMLERRKIESTLYLGTAKEKSGEFVAHAWLRSGEFYVSGSEVMNRFTVIGKFAKYIEK